jgi:hypothetical protein
MSLVFIYFLLASIVLLLAKQFKSSQYLFYLNPFNYFYIFTILYLIVPILFYSNSISGAYLIEPYVDIHNSYLLYSEYFISILAIHGLIRQSFISNIRRPLKILFRIDKSFLFYSSCLITLYISLVILINHSNFDFFGNRVVNVENYAYFNSKFKLNFASYVLVGLVVYQIASTSKLKYISFLSPILIFDLLTFGRYYLFLFFSVLLISFLLLNRKIPILAVGLLGVSIISVEFIRAIVGGSLNFDLLVIIPGELLLTYIHTIKDLYTGQQLITPSEYFDIILAKLSFISSFSNEISSYKPPQNFLGEVFFMDSKIFKYTYPFLVLLILEFLYFIVNKTYFLGIITLTFYVILLPVLFRNGIIIGFFELLYYLIYAVPWYFLFLLHYTGQKK